MGASADPSMLSAPCVCPLIGGASIQDEVHQDQVSASEERSYPPPPPPPPLPGSSQKENRTSAAGVTLKILWGVRLK